MNNKKTTDRVETCQCGKKGVGYYPFWDTSNGLEIKYLCPECYSKVNKHAKAIHDILMVPARGIWLKSFL